MEKIDKESDKKKINERIKEFSKTLSENERKLGFAAGGICWLFKEPSKPIFSFTIILALVALVLYFFFDLVHYLYAYLRERRLFFFKYGVNQTPTVNEVYNHKKNTEKNIYKILLGKTAFLILSFLLIILHLLVNKLFV